MTPVTRFDLQQLVGISPKLLDFFEGLFATGKANTDAIGGTVEATGAIQNATVLTLSPNAAFGNERVLDLDPAVFQATDGGPGETLAVVLVNVAKTNGGFACTFNLAADTTLELPQSGRVPSSTVGPYADDAAAAAAGVAVGEIYKGPTGTVVWRQV